MQAGALRAHTYVALHCFWMPGRREPCTRHSAMLHLTQGVWSKSSHAVLIGTANCLLRQTRTGAPGWPISTMLCCHARRSPPCGPRWAPARTMRTRCVTRPPAWRTSRRGSHTTWCAIGVPALYAPRSRPVQLLLFCACDQQVKRAMVLPARCHALCHGLLLTSMITARTGAVCKGPDTAHACVRIPGQVSGCTTSRQQTA